MPVRTEKSFNIVKGIKPGMGPFHQQSEPGRYSLPVVNTDITGMLTAISSTLPDRQRQIRLRGLTSSVWGESFSLRDIEGFENRFTNVTGAIKLPEIPNDTPYENFFTSVN